MLCATHEVGKEGDSLKKVSVPSILTTVGMLRYGPWLINSA